MRIMWWVATLWGMCSVLGLHANYRIAINQGHEGAIPLALVAWVDPEENRLVPEDLLGEEATEHGSETRSWASSLTQHVQEALQGMPRLAIQEVTEHAGDPTDWSLWGRARRVQHVVLLRLEPEEDGQHHTLRYQIWDVFREPSPSGLSVPWIDKRIKHVDLSLQDSLSQHVADVLHEQITGVPGVCATRIAYVLKDIEEGRWTYALNIVDAQGKHPKTVLKSHHPLVSPSWSPDGRHLAYVSFQNNRAELYRLRLSDGTFTRITHFPGINSAPAWSPDGRAMALVLSKSGAPKIYVLDLDTHVLEQITYGASLDTEPSWSPDGRSLVFTSNRSGPPNVYRYTFADRVLERLTYAPGQFSRASYTPDGKKLVLLHRLASRREQVAVLDLATQNMLPLTRHAQAHEAPSVAPNGEWVVYARETGPRASRMERVSLDGQDQVHLGTHVGWVQDPVWSPYLAR